MALIKIGHRIINLQNVKLIELIENSQGKEIRFYFIDGSYSSYNLKNGEEDIDFETAWAELNRLWVFSTDNFFSAV
jgi:hypothetical protein